MIAIIGGSGLAQLPALTITHRQVVRTPYGEPSCALTFGQLDGHSIVFLARHGYGHVYAPHEINYCANLWALKSLHVQQIIALASVGGVRDEWLPGSLVLPDQLIDYTWGRKHTFFEGPEEPVEHIDFTLPYCAKVRDRLLTAAQQTGQVLHNGGTYAVTQGPRLETAAEIARLKRDGADIVGMTGMPEAALARELGVSYACLAVVVNYAAGCGDSQKHVSLSAANDVMADSMGRIETLLKAALAVGC